MPGSPSPVGRKPGICQAGQLVTREGPEGSNPSPGAHLREISAGFKTHGCERETTVVVGLGERGLQLNAAKTLDVVAEEETKKMDYHALDRLIDLITRDFSRKGINSRLKALAMYHT
jgi:hypothetical protein